MAVLNTETSIENHPGNAQTDSGSGEHSVIFEHVDFVYPDGEEAVLKDISFPQKAERPLPLSEAQVPEKAP